jgi:hypothetical protein
MNSSAAASLGSGAGGAGGSKVLSSRQPANRASAAISARDTYRLSGMDQTPDVLLRRASERHRATGATKRAGCGNSEY